MQENSDIEVDKNNNAKLSTTVIALFSLGFHTFGAEIATVQEESSTQRAERCSDISKFHQKMRRRISFKKGGLSEVGLNAVGPTHFHFI